MAMKTIGPMTKVSKIKNPTGHRGPDGYGVGPGPMAKRVTPKVVVQNPPAKKG